MTAGSKRFTTQNLDKNFIVSYDASRIHKFGFIISTTNKDFIAEYHMTPTQAQELIDYIQQWIPK